MKRYEPSSEPPDPPGRPTLDRVFDPETIPCGLLMVSEAGEVLSINPFLGGLLGIAPEEIMGRRLPDVVPLSVSTFLDIQIIPMLRLEGHVEEIYLTLRGGEGEDVPVLANGRMLFGQNGGASYCFSVLPMRRRYEFEDQVIAHRQQSDALRNDTTKLNQKLEATKAELEEKQAELLALVDELGRMAMIDGLTGLKNKRALFQDLENHIALARRHAKPLSVLMVDVDHFKQINDCHGHEVGDQCLVRIAGLLRSLIRESDTAVRYGGDELLVLLPDTDRFGAEQVADKIVRGIAHSPWEVGQITVSVGVASYPEHADDGTTLVGSADKALYRSKREGRDCVSVAVLNE